MNMKCKNCDYENTKKAKFCAKCGTPLTGEDSGSSESGNNKILIIALVIVIIVLVGAIAYFAIGLNSPADDQSSADSQQDQQSAKEVSSEDESSQKTTTTASAEKTWVSIGSYSGSGSGSQTVKVPSGQIMIKISAYPIKNYATNHLYVSGSNGESAGVDWGSHSDVETRSDSVSYTSSSSETFTIDYYETVSWEVEFYRYQ